jgi:hypothetical protein
LPLVRECEAQPNRLVAQLSLSPPSRLLLVTSSHRDAFNPLLPSYVRVRSGR